MSPLGPRTALTLLLAACTGHERGEAPPVRDVAMVHEPCDISPDALHLESPAHSLDTPILLGGESGCISMDLNFDGKPEVYTYQDAEGRTRRRESDFDGDDHADEIAHYEAGLLVRSDRDLDGDHRVDSWDFHEHEQLVRRERDSDGDGRIDQWWTFTSDACPYIEHDRDGDGRPDPGSRVQQCP